MEPAATNLGRLLKQTRLSAHHASQVYSAAPAFASRGDFGLKRPLPTPAVDGTSNPSAAVGRLRYVQVSQQDTPEGQTEWKENERDTLFLQRWAEKNTRVAGFAESQWHEEGASTSADFSRRPGGSLGPRIRTVFDPATYRLLPSDFPEPSSESDPNAAGQLARLKDSTRMGAVTPPGLEDPFSSASSSYTRHLDVFPDYFKMTESQFERFLAQVRRARPELRKRIQNKTEDRVRMVKLAIARREREKAIRAAQNAANRGATPQPVPAAPREDEIEVPPIEADMWDESRIVESLEAVTFIKRREANKASRPRSKTLPFQSGRDTPLHPSAGLQYSQPDEIFTQRLAEALPGRVVIPNLQDLSRNQRRSSPNRRNSDLGVASGGHIEQLPGAVRDNNLLPYDPDRPSNARAEGKFRVISASMDPQMWTANLPREALQGSELGYIKAKVRSSNETREDLPTPGSTAYASRQSNSFATYDRPRSPMPWTSRSSRNSSPASAPRNPMDSSADRLGREGVSRMIQNLVQLRKRA